MATIVGGGKTSVNEQKIKVREIVLMRSFFVKTFRRNLYLIRLTGFVRNDVAGLLIRCAKRRGARRCMISTPTLF